jgi:hypothetical protein
MHAVFWLENLKGKDHLGDLGVNGFIGLRMGTNGGLL